MLPLVDHRIEAIGGVARAVDDALVAAARACTGEGIAVHAAAAVGGSAVSSRLGVPWSDIDIDAPLRIVLPPRLGDAAARTRVVAAVVAFVHAVADRLGPGSAVRFVGLQVAERPDSGEETWEWRPGEDDDRLHRRVFDAMATSLMLAAGGAEDPILVDVRLHRAFISPGGAVDVEARLGPFWFSHVAFSLDAARRFALHERTIARHFAERYDPERTWLQLADFFIAEQAADHRWLKVAKILPQRTAWVGEHALLERLPELLASPLAHAVSTAIRGTTALQLARRAALPTDRARAFCLDRLREAATLRATALPRAPAWPLADLAALGDDDFAATIHALVGVLREQANEAARRWLAALE